MRQIATVAGIHQFPPRSNMASGDFPWLEGNYKGTGYLEAVLIKGDTVTNDEYPDVVMTFSHGAFGEADKELAEATGQKNSNIEIKYSTFGMDLVEHGVLSEDGKKFTIKTMMGIWNLEWITAEEAEREFLKVKLRTVDKRAQVVVVKIKLQFLLQPLTWPAAVFLRRSAQQ